MTTTFLRTCSADGRDGRHQRAAGTAGVVSLVVLAVGLGGLALGIDWAWVAFPVGYGGVLPLVVARSRARAGRSAGERSPRRDGNREGDDRGEADALAVLKARYASGELDDEEFEGRVERLLSAGSDQRDGY